MAIDVGDRDVKYYYFFESEIQYDNAGIEGKVQGVL
jgi:hypothetical protein